MLAASSLVRWRRLATKDSGVTKPITVQVSETSSFTFVQVFISFDDCTPSSPQKGVALLWSFPVEPQHDL